MKLMKLIMLFLLFNITLVEGKEVIIVSGYV